MSPVPGTPPIQFPGVDQNWSAPPIHVLTVGIAGVLALVGVDVAVDVEVGDIPVAVGVDVAVGAAVGVLV